MTPIELLAMAVVRRAVDDLLEGYKLLYPKYGEGVLDYDMWDERPFSLKKRHYYIYEGHRYYNGTLSYEFANSLFFIYSPEFQEFCRLEPGVIIRNIKMLYSENPKAKIMESYNIINGHPVEGRGKRDFWIQPKVYVKKKAKIIK